MLFRKNKLKKAGREDEERFATELKENGEGLKDGVAMFLSALLVIVLPCLLVLLGLGGLFILLLHLMA